MKTLQPTDPANRIEILDVLRGFALLGIIFNNILYLSGYSFIPFDEPGRLPNFQLNEKLYEFLDIIITGKFYTLFSLLFGVGFYLQFSKYRQESKHFLKTYSRRLFILLAIGFIHSLIWFGDILFLYAIIGFILILFRNVKSKNLLRWAVFFIFLPVLMDVIVLLLFRIPETMGAVQQAPLAHSSFPDMTPAAVMDTFQNGTISQLFFLNIHHLIWKWMSYIPQGRFIITLGIFLLGAYLSSIQFFTGKTKTTCLWISTLIIGLLATVSAHIMGGNIYQFPPTPSNTLYKALLVMGQTTLSLFYIVTVFKIVQTALGRRVLEFLKPVGRMALTNYIFQTIVLIVIFYNVGFDLFGRTDLFVTVGLAILVLASQIVMSHIWLQHYRFGPLEWLWRSLTYKRRINIRYENLPR